MISRVLVFGDDYGVPLLMQHLPQSVVCGIVGASRRPHQHETLQRIARDLRVPFMIQPHDSFVEPVRDLNPDLIFVVSYSMLLPSELLTIPKHGAVNIHPALLPEYRGANPLQWAIINDETETGVTMHYMTPEFDTGDIISQCKVPIKFEDTWLDVHKQIAATTSVMLRDELPRLLMGTNSRIPQDESHAKHWNRRHPDDGLIDWTQSDRQIYNLIRALVSPLPGAFYFKDGKRIILNKYLTLSEVRELKGGIMDQVKVQVKECSMCHKDYSVSGQFCPYCLSKNFTRKGK